MDAVIALDMGLHGGLVDIPQLEAWTESRVARKGVRQLRYAVALAEPVTE